MARSSNTIDLFIVSIADIIDPRSVDRSVVKSHPRPSAEIFAFGDLTDRFGERVEGIKFNRFRLFRSRSGNLALYSFAYFAISEEPSSNMCFTRRFNSVLHHAACTYHVTRCNRHEEEAAAERVHAPSYSRVVIKRTDLAK